MRKVVAPFDFHSPPLMETEALPRQARDKRDGNTFAKSEGVSHTHRVDGNTIFKSWGAGIMVFRTLFLSHFDLKRPFYQDRLRTNIGKR